MKYLTISLVALVTASMMPSQIFAQHASPPSGINTPPILDPIGDKSVNELATLTFTATAFDAETPQALTFTLEDGTGDVPIGASITPGGIFTWTPTAAQGPESYIFDIVVSDGLLKDKETIMVNVNERNSDYSIVPVPEEGDNVFEATFGLIDCIIDPATGECVSVIMTQHGSDTVIDARTALIATHFDDTEPFETQVCHYKSAFANFADDPNPVCETFDIVKDGTVLTQEPLSLEADCGGPLDDGDTAICENGTVTRVMRVLNGAVEVGQLEIVYLYTNTLKFTLKFTQNQGFSGKYMVIQSQHWSEGFSTEAIITSNGTEMPLADVCSEANQIDALKGKVVELYKANKITKADRDSLLIHLNAAKKAVTNNNVNKAINELNLFKSKVQEILIEVLPGGDGTATVTITLEGQELIDDATNIIKNLQNSTATECIIVYAQLTGGSGLTSVHGGSVIIGQNNEGTDDLQDSSVTPTGQEFTYGPFNLSSTNPIFTIDPSVSTLTGASSDGQSFTGSGTGSSCPAAAAKDVTSFLLRARVNSATSGSSSSSAPVCSRLFMHWDTSPIVQTAAGQIITVTRTVIVFNVTSVSSGLARGCAYMPMTQAGINPATMTTAVLYTEIGDGTPYLPNNLSCQTVGQKIIVLGSQANIDVQNLLGILNGNWFSVGIKLTNDNVRGSTTDFVNIISANSTPKPVLRVRYTLS
jgi:hypothetical protein